MQRVRIISKRIINLAETIKTKIMTREEKCKLAIERGYTYDPETGLIYSKNNIEVGYICNTGYKRIDIKINNKRIVLKAHHFAWYYIYKECVEQLDHINRIRIDNRICNLRVATHQQNQWNKTKAKGYNWHKASNKWKSQIKLNNKCIYLGLFNSEQEARNAYLKAKEIYHKF